MIYDLHFMKYRPVTEWKFKNKDCVICGTSFKPTVGTGKTCGLECSVILNHKSMVTATKNYRISLRKKVIAGYGGACICCGESRFEFLALDHVNNDGAKHRLELTAHRARKGSSPTTLCNWVIRNNFPTSIQILCYNCNCSKGFNGYCPHQREGRV